LLQDVMCRKWLSVNS